MGQKSLKEFFPRLYNVSEQRNGVVEGFGVWSEGVWKWSFR